ncbi:MAG TPA: hypothetical protein VFX33_14600 [Actinomycetales bacterium]|nr:hypothetical protein [Actinomycetales bacterium]
MSLSLSSTSSATGHLDTPAPSRLRAGVVGALAAGVLLLAELAVALTTDGDLADHSSGAGRLSEALVGLAFVAGAAALALWLPSGRLRRGLCLPAVVGTCLTGLIMLLITVTGREVSETWTTIVVLLTLVGQVVQGVVGWRARVWPLWAGLLLGALMLVMFLVPNPANSAGMAAVWLLLALVVARR